MLSTARSSTMVTFCTIFVTTLHIDFTVLLFNDKVPILLGRISITIISSQNYMKNQMLSVGDKMPEFELEDQDGKMVSSKDLLKLKKKILIYFYPKDDTPGCTTEACGFRDFRFELADKGVEIVGISKDSVKSHKKFADKYKLNFTLLSDDLSETIQKFGAWGEKSMYGKKYFGTLRVSYLFGKTGKVEKVYGKVSTKENEHAQEILADVK